jgi:hypothetical protein
MEQYVIFLKDTKTNTERQVIVPERLELGRLLAVVGKRFKVLNIVVLSSPCDYLDMMQELQDIGEMVFGNEPDVKTLQQYKNILDEAQPGEAENLLELLIQAGEASAEVNDEN